VQDRPTRYGTQGQGRDNRDQIRLPTEPHNAAAEIAILGSCLTDGEAFYDVSPSVTPSDFHAPLHAQIYTAIASLISEGRTADITTLTPRLREMNLGDASAYDYVTGIPHMAASSREKLIAYVDEILRYSAQRAMLEASAQLAKLASSKDAKVHDIANAVTEKLENALNRIKPKRITQRSVGEYARMAIDESKNPDKPKGLKTGLTDFDKRTGGLFRGELSIVGGRPSMGKLQATDNLVLAADGTWRAMGHLRLGDALASWDGRPSRVTGIFPHGQKQLYRISFADGRSTEAGAEHLWRVMYREWDAPRVVDTAKLIEMMSRQRYKNRVWIDLVSGDFGADSHLPLDAYVLGSLIANGSLSGGVSIQISTPHPSVLSRVGESIKAHGATLAHDARVTWRLNGCRHVRSALGALGLMGLKAEAKFIPAAYFAATKTTRSALLQGLMDGDGWVETFGAMRYGTSSLRLAKDVQTLARSLGGLATISPRSPKYTYKGQKLDGQPAWVVNMSFADGTPFVSVPSKLERVKRERQARLTITSIEPSRIAETQCIAVSHPDRLYVTDDYIVTHNTVAAAQIGAAVAKSGHGVLYLSLEMDGQSMAQRMLSAECFSSQYTVPYTKFRSEELDDRDYRLLEKAQVKLSEIPFQVETHPGMTLPQVVSRVRRLKAEWAERGQSLDLLIIDYLTLLKFSDRWKGQRVYEVAELSTGLKELARTLDIHVMAVHQLSRGVESRDDKRPQMSDLRESGQLEQDADIIILCYREYYYLERTKKQNGGGGAEQERALREAQHQIELLVVKQRMGSVGPVTCYCDVASNVIRNLGAYA
jgi:replicative DNA helicase